MKKEQDEDNILELIPALEASLKYSKTRLAQFQEMNDSYSRKWANEEERIVSLLERSIKKLKVMNASNLTHYP